MEIHVQMRAVNLYTLTRKIDNEIYAMYEMALSDRAEAIRIRMEEIDQIVGIVNNFIFHGATSECYDNWFYSFSIPHIGKEFDMLKIGNNKIAVNIELKSQEVPAEKIEYQLLQNRYYLSHIADNIYSFSLVAGADGNCKLYVLDGELKETTFQDMLNKICEVQNPISDKLEDYFKPRDYLVSPLNTPGKFIQGTYFLSVQQNEIKGKIINGLSADNRIWGIQGAAGTGKSLLLYDVAKTASSEFRVCVIHSGIICEGHKTLNRCLHNVSVIEAKAISEELISQYDIICVDEAQRLYKSSVDMILSAYETGTIRGAIFAYDFAQVLSRTEFARNNPKRLKEVAGFREEKLSDRIRTNKELYSFIRNLLRLGDKARQHIEYKNVDILYANDVHEADRLVDIYKGKGYIPITFTPSHYVSSSIDHYSGYINSHEVIGQEFDYVLVVIDNNFRYDANGDLTAREHPNPEYLFPRLFYQNISRAREKLCIVVLNNQELFKKLLCIKCGE